MSSEIYCISAFTDFQGPFVFVCLFFLSASLFPFFYIFALCEGIMQRENTSNSLGNCKTTLMCANVNSLWLNNLPFSQTFQRGDRKLYTAIFEKWGRGGWCVIEGTGSHWQWRVSGMGVHCPPNMRQSKGNTKDLKCINFSVSDRTTCYFSGRAQKSWALRSSLEGNFTELPP